MNRTEADEVRESIGDGKPMDGAVPVVSDRHTPAVQMVIDSIRELNSNIGYQAHQVELKTRDLQRAQFELDRLSSIRDEFRSFIPELSDEEVSA